jgi:hypothetical protein
MRVRSGMGMGGTVGRASFQNRAERLGIPVEGTGVVMVVGMVEAVVEGTVAVVVVVGEATSGADAVADMDEVDVARCSAPGLSITARLRLADWSTS